MSNPLTFNVSKRCITVIILREGNFRECTTLTTFVMKSPVPGNCFYQHILFIQFYFSWRQMVWNSYFCAVVVGDADFKMNNTSMAEQPLTHWGRVTHLCASKLTSIASYNGLSPGRRQAIIWYSAEILLVGPLETNFSEIFIEIQTFSLKKIRLKMSSAKCRPFCLGLNVLIAQRVPSMGHSSRR